MDEKADDPKSTSPRTESPKSVNSAMRRRGMRRRCLKAVEEGGGGSGGEEDGTDREEVEKKIVELQRIVPGGKWVGVENLFEETATYILALQCQVEAMNAVASFLEGLEMEKRKLGGHI